MLLNKAEWDLISSWYGYDVEIPRQVVARGVTQTLVIDVYPPVFQLYYWAADSSTPEAVVGDDKKEAMVLLPSHMKIIEAEKYVIDMAKNYRGRNISSQVRICYSFTKEGPWNSLDIDEKEKERSDIASLEMAQQDIDFPILLIEERHGEDSKKYMSEVYANRWRHELKLGQLIDAQDTETAWYEAKVVELGETQIKVHYMGWTSKWDAWHSRDADTIAQLHTHVSNWRDFRVNDKVEVAGENPGRNFPTWHMAKVLRVLPDEKKIVVRRLPSSSKDPDEYHDIHGETICKFGTHLDAKPKVTTMVPSYTSSYSSWGRNHVTGRPQVDGVTGLQNLGNTCFMNSMLQCLNSSTVLTNYFLSGRHREDINYDNPLGMGGRVAEAYAALLKDIWSGKYTVVVPSQLKSVIGQYAPQFAGYQQQDSQELMSFLLDGLHEDLNRVRNKPYVEQLESNGRPDTVVAKESWEQHQSRNQSVIVDHCMAQLRSHITCPICDLESITFDPFMSLSVPLPVKSTRSIQLQLFWANGDVPTRFSVEVDKDGTILELKKSLSELCNVEWKYLLVVEVFSHRVQRVFDDSIGIHEVRKAELDVYQLETPLSQHLISSQLSMHSRSSYSFDRPEMDDTTEIQNMRLVSVLHRVPKSSSEEDSYTKHRRVELFGTPLILSVPLKATNNEIHNKMWNVVRRVMVPHTEFSAQNPPYKIEIANSSGTTVHCDELPHNDEMFKPPTTSNTLFTFTLEWTPEGYKGGYRESEAERVIMHDSMSSMHVSTQERSMSLDHCILKFTEREQLGENDTWYCPRCKEHRRAFKKFDLWSVPDILILHLKRFRYAQSSFFMHRDKIDTLVDFPIEGLDMSRYVIDPEVKKGDLEYDLFAVSEHSGGLGGGHYTCVVQNAESGKWFSISDSHVSETTSKSAITSQAYVLFYQRRKQQQPST